MRVVGRIVGVKADGYERVVRVAVGDARSHMVISASVPEQYIDESVSCQTYGVGQVIDAEVRFVYVTEASVVTKDQPLGFAQPISGSPHSMVIGLVTEVTAPDEFVCTIDEEGGQIVVSAEKALRLHVGMRIKFSAELHHAG
jgi:hypothetical protein